MPKKRLPLKPIIAVVVTVVVCAFALAFTYLFFKDTIAETEKKQTEGGIYALIEGATTLESLTIDIDGVTVSYYKGKDDAGALMGYAIPAEAFGYSEVNKFVFGYTADLSAITGMFVAYQNETPGLGSEIAKPKFTDQFKGKQRETALGIVKGTPNVGAAEIDAVTGATISSASAVVAANKAHVIASALKGMPVSNAAPDALTKATEGE